MHAAPPPATTPSAPGSTLCGVNWGLSSGADPRFSQPQHSTLVDCPLPTVAQANESPIATAVAPVKPVTWTGTDEDCVVPLPSCPLVLFPQHHTVPPLRMAHALVPPTAID